MKTALKMLAVLFILFLLVGSGLPARWEVSRSTVIGAPAGEIHPYLEDFRAWQQWMPWGVERDPSVRTTYSGAERGPGAVTSWTSEKDGPGTMEITASDPARGVWYDLNLEFGLVKGAFLYEARAAGTTVTWWSAGDNGWNLAGRWMGLLMDGMLGADMEQGLAALQGLFDSD